MIRNKFRYKVVNGAIYEFDWAALKLSMAQFEEGEIIVRKKIDWDTDQMRRYFHGPVLRFIQEQFKGVGYIFSKDQIKENLKMDFGPKMYIDETMYEKAFRNSAGVPKSTAEYDFDTYRDLLKDIDAWCIDCFQSGLPEPEQVE